VRDVNRKDPPPCGYLNLLIHPTRRVYSEAKAVSIARLCVERRLAPKDKALLRAEPWHIDIVSLSQPLLTYCLGCSLSTHATHDCRCW